MTGPHRSDGQTATIRRLLLVDRGAIARRIIRTCRMLGIETVAIHGEADGALPHLTEADLAVRLAPATEPSRGAPLAEASIDQLLDAARRTGADAVHPGDETWSMSSELSEAVTASGMTWVGLPAPSIVTIGSRIEARQRVRAANVAALAAIDVTGMDRVELLSSAERIGLPLVVKPLAGGGDGELARRVDAMVDVESTVVTTSRDATGELDDGRLFLERHVEAGRRLCVPVIAGIDGTRVALLEWESAGHDHGRELTESPSPAVDRELRRKLRRAAVGAATALDCVGLVTVEFVLTGEGVLRFLQITSGFTYEHLAAELATGLDLVALQLAAAEGKALALGARRPVVRGHAVAARVLPLHRPARFERFAIALPAPVDGLTPAAHVCVAAALPDAGGALPADIDVAAAVATVAPDRPAALRLAGAVLMRAGLHGTATNRERLVEALHQRSRRADAPPDTPPRDPVITPPLAPPPATLAAIAAAGVGLDAVESPDGDGARRAVELAGHRVAWRVDDDGSTRELTVDATAVLAEVSPTAPADGRCEVGLEIDGVRVVFPVHVTASAVYVDGPHGSFALVRQPATDDALGDSAGGWGPPAGMPAAQLPAPRVTDAQPAR